MHKHLVTWEPLSPRHNDRIGNGVPQVRLRARHGAVAWLVALLIALSGLPVEAQTASEDPAVDLPAETATTEESGDGTEGGTESDGTAEVSEVESPTDQPAEGADDTIDDSAEEAEASEESTDEPVEEAPLVAEEEPPIPGGPTGISEGSQLTTYLDSDVAFRHTIVHLDGELPDAKEIAVSSALGLPITVLAADGTTPLPDTTGDGLPDTGQLEIGASAEIVVQVMVPDESDPGSVDDVVIEVISAGDREYRDVAVDSIVVEARPTPEPTTEPTVEPTPEPAPDESASEEEDPLDVALLSEPGTTAPGEPIAYRFEIRNTAEETVTARITVENSVEGWAADVSGADKETPLDEQPTIAAGEAVDVVVVVTAPDGATQADRNTTTLSAVAVPQPGEAAGESEGDA